MDKQISTVLESHLKKNVAEVVPGDTIRVHQIVREGTKERIQVFEGVVIARRGGRGISATITVRKLSFGIGVERIFPLHSPRIVKIERVKSSQVRRSKLYYLRGLTGKAARLKKDTVDHKLWEEKGAEAEIAHIEEEIAAEAEARAEEKEENTEEVKTEDSQPMSDEEKAALAAGKPIDEPSAIESPEAVAHNEEVQKN